MSFRFPAPTPRPNPLYLCCSDASLLLVDLLEEINRLCADGAPVQLPANALAGGATELAPFFGRFSQPVQDLSGETFPVESGETHGRFVAEVPSGAVQWRTHDRKAHAEIF